LLAFCCWNSSQDGEDGAEKEEEDGGLGFSAEKDNKGHDGQGDDEWGHFSVQQSTNRFHDDESGGEYCDVRVVGEHAWVGEDGDDQDGGDPHTFGEGVSSSFL
jgi:hypothetical protein